MVTNLADEAKNAVFTLLFNTTNSGYALEHRGRVIFILMFIYELTISILPQTLKKMQSNNPITYLTIATLAISSNHIIAADVTMVVDNQSWLNPNVWSDTTAPSAANDYFTAAVGGGVLRTSPINTTGGGTTDFPGNSLTLITGTKLVVKQENTQVASINSGAANLIVDGGTVSFGPNSSGGPHSNTLNINELQITSLGAVLEINLNTAVATIDGTLTGQGDVLINYSNAGISSGRSLSIGSIGSAYTGDITVSEGVILDLGADATLAGGLTLTDSAVLHVDQNITIEGGKLVDSNGFVPGGVYTGSAITAIGPNFTDGGGTLTVTASDSDNDGLNDYWEDLHFGDMSGTIEPSDLLQSGTDDPDLDGANNEAEETAGSDPNVVDTDADGLNDGPELDGSLNTYSNLPTDPLDPDSDDDGILDGEEVFVGTDGWQTDPLSDDTDIDFLSDKWEIDNGLDPTDATGINGDFGDPDEDNLDNFSEQTNGTDPLDADTDDDGLNDDVEIFGTLNTWSMGAQTGAPGEATDPLVADSDGDTLSDGDEVLTHGTDPNSKDSDNDTFSDALEIAEASDPVDPASYPAGFVTVTSTTNGVSQPGITSDASGNLLTVNFADITGSNLIALVLTSEGIVTGTGFTAMAATFDGQTMNVATISEGAQNSTIFYLLNPGSASGDIVINVGGAGIVGDAAYSTITMSGVTGVLATPGATTTSSSNTTPFDLNYTTTNHNGLVLAAAANNDFNNARKLSLASGSPDQILLPHTVVNSSGHFHSYGRLTTSGAQTDSYYGQYSRTAIQEVVFTAVPIVSTGFAHWADTNGATGQSPSDDHDMDGMPNGVEYFMGETGSNFTVNATIVGGSIIWPKDPAYSGNYQVEISSDLVNWTPVASTEAGDGSSVSYSLPTIDPKLFVRLLVDPN